MALEVTLLAAGPNPSRLSVWECVLPLYTLHDALDFRCWTRLVSSVYPFLTMPEQCSWVYGNPLLSWEHNEPGPWLGHLGATVIQIINGFLDQFYFLVNGPDIHLMQINIVALTAVETCQLTSAENLAQCMSASGILALFPVLPASIDMLQLISLTEERR